MLSIPVTKYYVDMLEEKRSPFGGAFCTSVVVVINGTPISSGVANCYKHLTFI